MVCVWYMCGMCVWYVCGVCEVCACVCDVWYVWCVEGSLLGSPLVAVRRQN